MTIDELTRNIPTELRSLPQWVNRRGKIPYTPGTDRQAKAGMSETWGTFKQAVRACQSGGFDGIGFEFADNGGIVGIDLDHVVDKDTNEVKGWALDIVSKLRSYTEYSPSGTGLHIFVYGDIPKDGRKKIINKETGEAIELYKAKRYFTVTGRPAWNTPLADRSAELAELYAGLFPDQEHAAITPILPPNAPEYLQVGLDRDKRLRALWDGQRDTTDESSNDLALLNKLAYWCNKDEALMIDAFMRSPFAAQKDNAHKKKLMRDDYLHRTAQIAINGCMNTAAGDNEAYRQNTQPAQIECADVFGRTEYQEKPKEFKLSIISAAELQGKQLPPVKFIVDGFLPQGLALLASPPKYGKSWFVLDLCLSVAAGEPFLSHNTNKGSGLYLALEDSERRLQDRMNKLLAGKRAPDGFYYATSAATIGNGLIEQLTDYLQSHPDTQIIVIDTLQKVRTVSANKDIYGKDYNDMALLKKFADDSGICLLVVHHLRKAADDGDPFNRISGTNGIMGAADTAMVLAKAKRQDANTTLSVTGRDVDSSETIIFFDKITYRWQVMGDADWVEEQQRLTQYRNSPIVQTIRELLKQSPLGWRGTASELFQACIDIAGAYPADNTTALGKKLRSLKRELFENDGIICEEPKNSKRIYTLHFNKKQLNFTDINN